MGFYIQIDVKAITKLFHINNRRMRFEIQIDELISTGIFKLFYGILKKANIYEVASSYLQSGNRTLFGIFHWEKINSSLRYFVRISEMSMFLAPQMWKDRR